ncbi:MAG TPA: adenylyltransferase/cytidyltransferase family protein, partial [Verrucomicrobiae bacterium]|nr:adenylyltransferase/cytidyltransferase family protein [Verrucomicrobiae bacterium]
MNTAKQVIVSGGFDDIRARQLRFLDEASRLGELTVLLWTDEAILEHTGKAPKFPLAERLYFLEAVRFVSRVRVAGPEAANALPRLDDIAPGIWVDEETEARESRRRSCERHGIEYCPLPASRMAGFPELPPMPSAPGRKKVIATGCYDWFHSGHVRFTEEASRYGDLYVVVGHDANIRMLKGEGHPLLPQDERRYAVGSIRFVKQALIATGEGWLDAEPEIRRLKPDAYVVNEDGDRGGKREYCAKMGLEYIVLKRTPA